MKKKILLLLLILIATIVSSVGICAADIYDLYAVQRFRQQTATPGTPGTGVCKWYFKSDGLPYYICAGGSETRANGNADVADTVTVVDSTDASSYVAIFDSATGNLAAKTDAGFTYNASTGIASITGLALTNAPSIGGTAVSANGVSLITAADYAAMKVLTGWYTSADLGTSFPGISGTITDEQLLCGENTDGTNKVKSCGAKTIDNSTTGNVIVKTGTATVGDLSTQNVVTSGYLTGKMYAVVVAVPSGVHDGDNDAAVMTDAGIDLGASALIGMTVYNVTDGSSCTITANTATTITCTLAGGTGNDWDTNDVWQVGPGPSQSGSVFYVGSAGTIRHPATVGYLAGYYTTAAAAVIINPASDTMVITNATASAIDAGDAIDSPATAGSFIFLHNASATLAYTLGKNGTYTDGGAD